MHRRRFLRESLATGLTASMSMSRPASAQEERAIYTAEPVHPDGTEVALDLPPDLYMRNTVGSNNLGLCVYTSMNHAAYWQSIQGLYDLQQWMTARPGGGYPKKVDRELREKAPGLDYAHYLGPDPGGFIAAAIQSSRMPCVTYGYGERYSGTIAHMVNLVHYDPAADLACFLDNNDPTHWCWTSCREADARMKHPRGEAWVLVFFPPGPPPAPFT